MKAPPEISTSLSLQPDVFFVLVSGKTGAALGGPVKYNVIGEGKVIGPQVHITSRGAIYILFGFGKMHRDSQVLHLSEKEHYFYLNWLRIFLGCLYCALHYKIWEQRAWEGVSLLCTGRVSMSASLDYL